MKRFNLLLFLLLAAPAWAQTITPLDCSVVGTGSFKQGAFDAFTFTGAPGDVIIVRAILTSADPGFSARVNVVDPANRTLNPRNGAPTASATVHGEFELPAGGPYQIRVQKSTEAAGSYKVVYTFLNRPCAPSTLSCGAGMSTQINTQLQMNTHQYQAAPGDVLSLRITKQAPFTTGSGLGIFIYTAKGQLFTLSNDQPAFGVLGAGGTGRMDFRVPEGGLLNVLIFDPSPAGHTDNYAISITRLNGPCANNPLGCGTLQQSRINTPLSIDSYSVNLAAGESVAVKTALVAAGNFVPLIEVYDENAAFVPPAATINQGSPAISFVFTARSGGTYTVLIRDGNTGTATGAYAATLVRLNRPCGATTVSCGSILDGSLSGLLAVNAYTLSGAAGDVFLLRIMRPDQNSSFRPRIEIFDSRGNVVELLTVAADTGRLPFSTVAGGLYTIIVTDFLENVQSGAYVLSLERLNRPCNTAPISCGTPVTSSLTRPLASSAFTYSAAPGESFSVRMIDQSGTLQPVLEIYDSQGVPIGSNLSGSFTGVDVTQPAGGAYTIYASDGTRRPSGGTFLLELLRTANPCAATPPQGETRSGLITGPAPFAVYKLPVNAGDSLLVRSASFTSGFSAQMELYDPSGRRLDSQTFRLARTAPAAGNYTVIVGAAGARTGGAFAFNWQLLNNPAGVSALQCGATASASLSTANPFRYYSASANAGDLMRLIFTRASDNFSPQFELFDPAGSRLSASPDVSQKASADGNYLVLVSPGSSTGETGSYALSYQRPNSPCNPAPLTCGQTMLRQVNLPGQLDTFTFDGTGGNRANLRFSLRTGSYAPFAELYDAAGNRVTSSSTGSLLAVLPATGSYSVLVRDRAATSLGSYRVSLQDDTSVCSANDREAPVLTLLQPTGGEVAAGAAPFQIAWQSDDNVGVTVHEVAVSIDGGKTFAAPLAGNLSGNTQSYTWAVPADIAPSRTGVIRVTATDSAGNVQTVLSGPVSIIGSGFTPTNTITYTYDTANRLTEARMNDGRAIQYTWDAAGNLVQVTVTGQ